MTYADLARVAEVLPRTGSVLMQLSTYSVNGGNTQAKVTAEVASGLEHTGLVTLAVVKTDEQMMSMVFGRSCPAPLVGEISVMPRAFESWLNGLRMNQAIRKAQPNRRLHPTAAGQQLPPLPRLPHGRRG
jgi:hypothetical protein